MSELDARHTELLQRLLGTEPSLSMSEKHELKDYAFEQLSEVTRLTDENNAMREQLRINLEWIRCGIGSNFSGDPYQNPIYIAAAALVTQDKGSDVGRCETEVEIGFFPSDKERIERLEKTLTALISFSSPILGDTGANQLLGILTQDKGSDPGGELCWQCPQCLVTEDRECEDDTPTCCGGLAMARVTMNKGSDV